MERKSNFFRGKEYFEQFKLYVPVWLTLYRQFHILSEPAPHPSLQKKKIIELHWKKKPIRIAYTPSTTNIKPKSWNFENGSKISPSPILSLRSTVRNNSRTSIAHCIHVSSVRQLLSKNDLPRLTVRSMKESGPFRKKKKSTSNRLDLKYNFFQSEIPRKISFI